jgi:hypothetical protein
MSMETKDAVAGCFDSEANIMRARRWRLEREGFVFIDEHTAMRRAPPVAPPRGERRVEICSEDTVTEVRVGPPR